VRREAGEHKNVLGSCEREEEERVEEEEGGRLYDDRNDKINEKKLTQFIQM